MLFARIAVGFSLKAEKFILVIFRRDRFVTHEVTELYNLSVPGHKCDFEVRVMENLDHCNNIGLVFDFGLVRFRELASYIDYE